MLEFKGTSEQQWLDMQAHRVKDILNSLREYKKKHPDPMCPLMSRRK